MDNKKIKVVWITHVSNKKIRDHLTFENRLLERLVRRLSHRPRAIVKDMSQWVTNGLNEYEKCADIELHLIAPHQGIRGLQEFELDGIHYHFFRSEDDFYFLKRAFKKPDFKSDYINNRRIIIRLINLIKPDIVHLIGAENPRYSLVALDVDTEKMPMIVSLQTLMSAPDFKDNYYLTKDEYDYRTKCEQRIIRHSSYIGTKVERFRVTVWEDINPKAIFLNTSLFVGETINRIYSDKKYDIIYFAKDIAKAVDITLNVVAEVIKQRPKTTVCILGGCSTDFKCIFESLLDTKGLRKCIDYLGSLPTHDDVLSVLRSARVAVLPVKIESITGTMREAMANGIPIVTTRTWGTPALNEKRKTAFIREQDDFVGLANDVVALLEDNTLYNEMRDNGYYLMEELYSNESLAKVHNEIYQALVRHYSDGIAIPSKYCFTNPKSS